MPRTLLTDRWLRSHRPAEREEFGDAGCPGLVVRFGTGAPVFYLRIRESWRYVRRRLGEHPDLSLADARSAVLAAQKRRRRADRPGDAATTLADLVAAFLRQRRARGRVDPAGRRRRDPRRDPGAGLRTAGQSGPGATVAALSLGHRTRLRDGQPGAGPPPAAPRAGQDAIALARRAGQALASARAAPPDDPALPATARLDGAQAGRGAHAALVGRG